ncbi:methyltransferase domain-containing protein [Longispora sp. NPDC051575]|uniref:methyltransferase domain-containing protein n=1 Tax=Longispora sp. NPDC051575 TaxID=3154943 RepID=UPI003440951D
MNPEPDAPSPAVPTEAIRAYDDIFVPALFHPWACHLAGALAPRPGGWALDVGCGPGTVARVLAACVGPRGAVAAVDTNPAMLTMAVEKPEVRGAPITYRHGEAADLGLPDDCMDGAACQQVLQFVPDLPAALAEIRRVLKPGAPVASLVWAGLSDNPLFEGLCHAVTDVLGPAAGEAFAHPWHLDGHTLTEALALAGFTAVTACPRTLPAMFAGGPTDVFRFFGFSAVGDTLRTLDPTGRADLYQATCLHLAPFVHHGTVYADTTATLLLAHA